MNDEYIDLIFDLIIEAQPAQNDKVLTERFLRTQRKNKITSYVIATYAILLLSESGMITYYQMQKIMDDFYKSDFNLNHPDDIKQIVEVIVKGFVKIKGGQPVNNYANTAPVGGVKGFTKEEYCYSGYQPSKKSMNKFNWGYIDLIFELFVDIQPSEKDKDVLQDFLDTHRHDPGCAFTLCTAGLILIGQKGYVSYQELFLVINEYYSSGLATGMPSDRRKLVETIVRNYVRTKISNAGVI